MFRDQKRVASGHRIGLDLEAARAMLPESRAISSRSSARPPLFCGGRP
jgi:hypothetical protein